MKRLFFLFVAISILLFSACGNNSGKKKTPKTKAVSIEEQYITADLKIKMDSLVSSLNMLGMIPIVENINNGSFTLTAKEKKVKPDYLLPPSKVNDIMLLSHKYRAVIMFRIDQAIAELYGMPTAEYKEAIAKLFIDIDNDAFSKDLSAIHQIDGAKNYILDFYNESLEDGNINYFWEAAVAGMVEQVYILTRDIDKFIVCFDDEAASEISYRFSLVHDGVASLIPFHPEMKSLDAILEPLYVINAINVEQLKKQLLEIKDQIEVTRNSLLN